MDKELYSINTQSSACNNAGDFHLQTTQPNLEKASNENDLRIKMDGDSDNKLPYSTNLNSSSDGLQMLLIQKECEIVILRSELEFYKKQNHQKELPENEKDGFLWDKDDDFDSISLAEKENESISEKLTCVQRYIEKDITIFPSSKTCSQGVNIACQTIPSIMNSGDGREYLEPHEMSKMEEYSLYTEILDSADDLINPVTTVHKIKEYYRKEFEREKHVLLEKELNLEQEKLELEELRKKLNFKEEELYANKMKIEKEMRKILDDDESVTDKDTAEEKSEKEKKSLDEDQVKESKYQSELSLTLSSDDEESIFERADYLQIHVDHQPQGQKVRGASESSYIGSHESVYSETKDCTHNTTEELINVCENKINGLYKCMSIWKSEAEQQEQETKTMLNKFAKRNEVFEDFTSRSDTCHEIVNDLSKEWEEVSELREEIRRQREDLITQKSELEARAIAIAEKEKILNEDKTESEKRKQILNVNWDCLQLEADHLNNEKQMLIKEIQSLEETKNVLEKEKNELTMLKAQYEEEMLIAEEIQRQVDERRAQTMLEQQKCLDEKWEALNNEKEELKKAWRTHESQLLTLDIEKNTVSREHTELKILQQSLEKEKLSFEKERNRLEEEWKKIFSQNKDLGDNFAKLTVEKEVVTEEMRQLNNEKAKVKEMIESLNSRREEIKKEELILGENKLRIANEKEKLNKLMAEAETEWKKIKIEKKEWLSKKDEHKNEKSVISKKLEKSDMKKIKNKIYKLAETVSIMEKDAAMINATKKQRFVQHTEERFERRINERCQCSKYLEEKVYSLLEMLNNMEEDALKIRIKFNEQAKFQKRVKIIRKKMKCGRIKHSKPQEYKKIPNEMHKKGVSSVLTHSGMNTIGFTTGMRETDRTKYEETIGINLIPRLRDNRGNSFTTVLREEYITDLTPRRANYAKEKAKYLVDEWKKTYIVQGDNFYTTTLKDQADVLQESSKQRYENINLNCWENYSIDKIKVAELTPSKTYNCADGLKTLKEKTPWHDGKLKETQCSYTTAHTSDNLQCNHTFRCSMQKLESKFKMHSPFSYMWIEKPNLPASSRIRRERILSVQRGCLNYII